MIESILEIVWLFLGAGFANMTPLLIKDLPLLKNWNTPMDFGGKFRGKPIFGKNKTWRGLICGIVIAILTVYIQQLLLEIFDKKVIINSTDFSELSPIVFGAALGAGALLGDAVESFLKRQAGIAPGKSWFPFDQFDYIIGGTLLTYPLVPLTFNTYVLIFTVGFALHLLVNYLAFLLKLKDDII